jgi:hypothetical protein
MGPTYEEQQANLERIRARRRLVDRYAFAGAGALVVAVLCVVGKCGGAG